MGTGSSPKVLESQYNRNARYMRGIMIMSLRMNNPAESGKVSRIHWYLQENTQRGKRERLDKMLAQEKVKRKTHFPKPDRRQHDDQGKCIIHVRPSLGMYLCIHCSNALSVHTVPLTNLRYYPRAPLSFYRNTMRSLHRIICQTYTRQRHVVPQTGLQPITIMDSLSSNRIEDKGASVVIIPFLAAPTTKSNLAVRKAKQNVVGLVWGWAF